MTAAVVGQLLVRPSPDVGWLLYATRELFRGARLGVDLLEVTPPMIFLPKLPVVGFAQIVGVGLWDAWVVGMVVLVIFATVLTRRLLPATPDEVRGVGSMATLTIAFAMLVLPAMDFGQREHLTAVLILPYVVLAARRLTGESVSPRLAVLVGVMGGVGIGIKPHFILIFAGILALEAWRLGRRLPRPEHLSVVLVGIFYVAVVGVLIPGYYTYALDYGLLYNGFLSFTPWETVLLGNGTLPGLVGVGVFVVLRRYLPTPMRSLADALATATAAFYLAAVLQGKGWRYHFLPSMIFAWSLLGVLLAWATRRLTTLHRVYLGLGAATAAAMVISPLLKTGAQLTHPSSALHDADPNFGTLLPIVREAGPGASVAVLSSNIHSAFPLILESGATWPLRVPSLWPLIAFYSDSLDWGHVIQPRTPDRWSSLERSFADGIIQDLEMASPTLIIVLRPDAKASGWGGARHFDYLEYFSQDQRFARLLSGYRLAGAAGTYDVYVHGISTTTPSLAPPTPPGSARIPGDVLAWILTALGASIGVLWAWKVTGGEPISTFPEVTTRLPRG